MALSPKQKTKAQNTVVVLGLFAATGITAWAIQYDAKTAALDEKAESFKDSVATVIAPAINEIQNVAHDDTLFVQKLKEFQAQQPDIQVTRQNYSHEHKQLVISTHYQGKPVIVDTRTFPNDLTF